MIGERLAELRKLNGDTQESMAKKLHTSTNAVRGWDGYSPRADFPFLLKKIDGRLLVLRITLVASPTDITHFT